MAIEPGPNPTAVASKFCFACGRALDARAEICPGCGVRQPSPAVTGTGVASVSCETDRSGLRSRVALPGSRPKGISAAVRPAERR